MARRIFTLLTLCATVLAAQVDASAAPPTGKDAPEGGQPAPTPEAVREALESGDEPRILAMLETLAKAGETAKPALPHVEALLRRGANAPILEKALATVGAMQQPASSAVVAPYVRHRVPEVRRAATKALLKTRGPDAVKALRAALRSSDAVVRGTAATGLGSLGASAALPDLFDALDHGVAEAAAAIGQLCAAEQCLKFADRLGKLPLDVMTSGLEHILFRPEIADDTKLAIVARLRELGSREAGNFLADVADRWPPKFSTRVKQALDAAVKATRGAGGSKGR